MGFFLYFRLYGGQILTQKVAKIVQTWSLRHSPCLAHSIWKVQQWLHKGASVGLPPVVDWHQASLAVKLLAQWWCCIVRTTARPTV